MNDHSPVQVVGSREMATIGLFSDAFFGGHRHVTHTSQNAAIIPSILGQWRQLLIFTRRWRTFFQRSTHKSLQTSQQTKKCCRHFNDDEINFNEMDLTWSFSSRSFCCLTDFLFIFAGSTPMTSPREFLYPIGFRQPTQFTSYGCQTRFSKNPRNAKSK